MSLSASAGLVLSNHKSNFAPQAAKTNQEHPKANNEELLKRKKEEPKQVNPFDISQEQLNAQMAAISNPIQSAPAETLGTMAYTGGGAEAAGTMAYTGSSVASINCVA